MAHHKIKMNRNKTKEVNTRKDGILDLFPITTHTHTHLYLVYSPLILMILAFQYA